MKKAREWLGVILVNFAIIEATLFCAAYFGILNVTLPSYSLASQQEFWTREPSLSFGVWHATNAKYRHRARCFDVTYDSNAHGMRDRDSPLRSSERRVVILGDSFAEGYGARYGERFSEFAEARTGVEHLNFGTSGGFGPTQQYLLYKDFASRFDHSAVIMAILPNNDFLDDEPNPKKMRAGKARRPYLSGAYPDYEIVYPAPGRPAVKWNKKLTGVIREFSMILRTVEYLDAVRRYNRRNQDRDVQSYYFDFTPPQYDRLKYSIERIAALASPRPLFVFTIPRPGDYVRGGRENRAPPLRIALAALAADKKFTYIDLLSQPPNDFTTLFLPCDGHWSAAGHEAAAKVIAGWAFYRVQ